MRKTARSLLTLTTATLFVALGGGLASCTSSSSSPSGSTRIDDTTADSARAACQFGRGATATATLGKSTPVGSDIPIKNVVVVMMENHSFDSYYSHLNQYASRTDIESAPDTAVNVDAHGQPQPFTHGQHLCVLDVNHEWDGTHQEINGGMMDGFAAANDGYNTALLPAASTDPSFSSGGRAMWWYDERDIPFYYALASTFALADHYFAAVPGPTWPNRMFLYSGTSFGEVVNIFPDVTGYPFPGDNPASILDELETSKTTWMLYTDGLPTAELVYGFSAPTRWGRTVLGTAADFLAAAQAGTLPQVSFVDPNMTSEMQLGAGLDEHPPGDMANGEKFASDVVHALFSSPQWPGVALFFMYDEHGGFYDHVAPPKACPPDSNAPLLDAGPTAETAPGVFDVDGVRVPMMVVSPYAKKGYVGHVTYDHTSVLRFIEAKFNLPALTARDANAAPPTDMFDFSTPAFLTPPSIDAPTVDPTELSYCETSFGN